MSNIVLSASAQNVLSKQQQLFNRLVKNIEREKVNLDKEKKKLDNMLIEYSKSVYPLKNEAAVASFHLAQKIDKFTIDCKISKSKKKKLGEIICAIMDEVFTHETATSEQEALYDKWSSVSYKDEQKEVFENTKEEFKNMFESMTGEEIDLSDFEDNPESHAKFYSKMNEKINDIEAKRKSTKDLKKKTAKQIEKEKKAALVEEMKSKNLKGIYFSLAKLLHPDTELDETIKVEKEEVMKKVTEAYNNKDLITLLQLEIEWVHKNNNNIHTLKDDVISIYCDVLKEQLKQIQFEKISLSQHPRYQNLFKQDIFGFNNTPIKIPKLIKDLKNQLEGLAFFSNKIEFLYISENNFDKVISILQKHYLADDEMDILGQISFSIFGNRN